MPRVMRVADLVQAFPIYIFIIAMVFALGPGETIDHHRVRCRVVGALRAPHPRRGVAYPRHRVRLAARSGGLSKRRVLLRHVLPNAISQTIVYFPADILIGILSLGAFSYLGLGIQPPRPEWGDDDRRAARATPDAVVARDDPRSVITVLGCGLMLIADGLDDYWRSR